MPCLRHLLPALLALMTLCVALPSPEARPTFPVIDSGVDLPRLPAAVDVEAFLAP